MGLVAAKGKCCPRARRSIRRGSNACGRSRRAKAVLAASLAAGATSSITSRCWHCTVALLLQQCYGSMTAELAMIAAPTLGAGDKAGTIRLPTALQKFWLCKLCLHGSSDLVMEPLREPSWADRSGSVCVRRLHAAVGADDTVGRAH